MKRIYIIGTADTKGAELAFLARQVSARGSTPVIVDVGTRAPATAVDISADTVAVETVAGHGPVDGGSILSIDDRGAAVAAMGEAFARYVVTRDDIGGIIGIGGGGGTSIITAGLRALPLGLPKVMVSTLASGDIAPYVGVSDIMMVPSVTDLAGLNRLSRVVLGNAANAIAGMAQAPPMHDDPQGAKPALGLTMFGVTTPAVTAIAADLTSDYDCMVFHATGTGGRAMEKLADSGMLAGVIDITTTEICDLLYGGVLAATEDRLGAICRTGLPYVGSVGALDMINFAARETVPAGHEERTLYQHNPQVTLMRTTADECREIGRWIATRLNRMEGPVRLLIPEGGVSALDIAGGVFFDAAADAALFDAIEEETVWTDQRRLLRLPCHINDRAFADAAVAAWREIAP